MYLLYASKEVLILRINFVIVIVIVIMDSDTPPHFINQHQTYSYGHYHNNFTLWKCTRNNDCFDVFLYICRMMYCVYVKQYYKRVRLSETFGLPFIIH